MSIKLFCDFCGNEILPKSYAGTIEWLSPITSDELFTSGPHPKSRVEVCDVCFREVDAYLRAKYKDTGKAAEQ